MLRPRMKIFFTMGILFAVSTGIFQWLVWRSSFNIFGVIIGGVFYGFFMSSFMVSKHVRLAEKTEEALKMSASRTVNLNVPFGEAFDLCLESLEDLGKRYRLKEEERGNGKVTALVSAGFGKARQKVSFLVLERDGGKSTVAVSSRQASFVTLVDYWENADNTELLSSFLSRRGSVKE